MRIDRMLAITVILLNRKRISARALADKFEVSVRTIYRDIDALNSAGIPVVSYPGNDGGFGIVDTFKLDRQLFTFRDMISVISALNGLNKTLEDSELDNVIEKIRNLVPREKSGELDLSLEQFIIDVLPWGARQKQRELIQIVHNAIVNKKLLEFTYRNSKGEETRRAVEPMTLLFKGYAWYLFGFCQLRNDYRFFRLSRISNPDSSQIDFQRRDKSYNEFETDQKNQKPVSLVFKFSPEVRFRVEDFFDPEDIEILENGGTIVRVQWPEDEWVYSMILSYGEHIQVLEPAHICEKILQKVKKIVTNFQT